MGKIDKRLHKRRADFPTEMPLGCIHHQKYINIAVGCCVPTAPTVCTQIKSKSTHKKGRY